MQGENTNKESEHNDAPVLPGAVISPGSSPDSVAAPSAPPAIPEAQPQLYPEQARGETAPVAPQPQQSQPLQDDGSSISWVAPQFISHNKSNQWFVICLAGAVLLAAIIYLITKDFLSAFTIALAIVVLGAYSYRKPNHINFKLNEDSVEIGTRSYPYEQFRSFTAVPEGPYLSVTLYPLRRFAPLVGLYYMGQDEQVIVDFIADRLPMQEHKSDLIDNLMRLIKF